MFNTQCGNLAIFLPLTQILCETNFIWDSRSSKFSRFDRLEPLKLDFNDSFATIKGKIYQTNIIQNLWNCKNGSFFQFLEFSRLISRKIWVAEKFSYFHTVLWMMIKQQQKKCKNWSIVEKQSYAPVAFRTTLA